MHCNYSHSFLIIYGFLFLSISTIFNWGYAQNPNSKIDSLEILSKNKRSFSTIHALADLYSDSDLKKAEKLGFEAVKIANNEEDMSQQALAYNTMGNIFQYQSKLDSSLIFTKKALELRIKIKDSLGIADSYNNLGIVYDQKANYEEALHHYFKALKIYQNHRDYGKEAMVASNIGVVYKAQKDYQKSLNYYSLAYRLYQKVKNEFGKTVTSGNIGSTLVHFQRYKDALHYNKIAKDGYKKLHLERFLGYPVGNDAVVYDSLKNVDLASKKYEEAIYLHTKFGNTNEAADNSKNFSDFLFRQKKYDESIQYAQKALEFATKNDVKLLENEVHFILAKNYAALGNYEKAYQHQFQHINGKNVLFEKDKTKTLFELEKKYESAKKDAEILETKNKIYKRNIFIASLLGCLFLGCILALSYFRHRKKNEKIRMQQEILHQEQLSARAVIQTEDKERKRMATHLHDGIGQSLSVLNMNISVMEDFREDVEQFNKILDKTKVILDDAIQDVRTLSHNIMPNMLIKNSLSDALRDLIEKSNSPKLQVLLKMEGLDEGIDPNIQVVVYRVIQECIQNTIKHSEAKSVSIAVKQTIKTIKILISDDGKGFNPLQIKTISNSVGLENIKSRIDFLKGSIKVDSALGKGTSIDVKIPLS